VRIAAVELVAALDVLVHPTTICITFSVSALVASLAALYRTRKTIRRR
jgi:hypothetical protein